MLGPCGPGRTCHQRPSTRYDQNLQTVQSSNRWDSPPERIKGQMLHAALAILLITVSVCLSCDVLATFCWHSCSLMAALANQGACALLVAIGTMLDFVSKRQSVPRPAANLPSWLSYDHFATYIGSQLAR